MDQPTYKLADHLHFDRTGTQNFFDVPQAWVDTINKTIGELAGAAIQAKAVDVPLTDQDLTLMMVPIRDHLEQQYGPFTFPQLLSVTNAITFYYASLMGFNGGYERGRIAGLTANVISSISIKGVDLVNAQNRPGSGPFTPPKAEA
ncbi:hypothetical protein FAES_3927 [Fibrella aestuarina BUZ 2]|uniref:Uncharacterized protein n=1 Tax=Fibrella aestuarina BUZ 2 TaxID=1166018 RepID=I0KCT0_9BACT|nr:hypothetical protein [Fibrella aestuarina]CCH01933.1 hypothetical protein FAES_3927 [Fibrella aestuarina BUZ 2]